MWDIGYDVMIDIMHFDKFTISAVITKNAETKGCNIYILLVDLLAILQSMQVKKDASTHTNNYLFF
jgi:predicted glycosyltransferase